MALDILSYAMGKAAGGGSGGEADLIDATFTSNGTYSHRDHDGYDNVTVDVANSYTASDEGKVVSSGALVSQTSTNISSNGTYTTTTNNEVVVDVPNSYAAGDEGKVVSNGSLVSQSSTTKTANGTYDTTLNNEVVINVPTGITPTGTISITSNGTTDVTNYASASVNVPTNTPDNYYETVYDNNNKITAVNIYTNKSYIPFRLQGMSPVHTNGADVNIYSSSLTELPDQFAYGLGNYLKSLNYSNWNNITNLGSEPFYNCYNFRLPNDSLPSSLNSNITSNSFYACSSLIITEIPAGVTGLYSRCFMGCSGITQLTFKGTPSIINSTSFSNCTNLTDIYVPWAENAIAGAPWGASNATVHYNSVV